MTKLNQLLAQQKALTEEVAGLELFVDRVHGKGTLVMTAVSENGDADGIIFTPEDLGIELEVLKPLTVYLAKARANLAAVNEKVAALELLLG